MSIYRIYIATNNRKCLAIVFLYLMAYLRATYILSVCDCIRDKSRGHIAVDTIDKHHMPHLLLSFVDLHNYAPWLFKSSYQ